jgi:hypothetical protein
MASVNDARCVRDADQFIAETEFADDLGRARQQGDDFHIARRFSNCCAGAVAALSISYLETCLADRGRPVGRVYDG